MEPCSCSSCTPLANKTSCLCPSLPLGSVLDYAPAESMETCWALCLYYAPAEQEGWRKSPLRFVCLVCVPAKEASFVGCILLEAALSSPGGCIYRLHSPGGIPCLPLEAALLAAFSWRLFGPWSRLLVRVPCSLCTLAVHAFVQYAGCIEPTS